MRPPRSIRLATLRSPLLIALIGLCVASGQPARGAITVALDPDASQVDPLGDVNIAVTIAGLGSGVAPSVGVYELDVTFDDGLLSLGTPTYGDPTLGDQLALLQNPNISTDTSTPGLANLFELSLDTVADLDTLQAPAFTMVTLPFTALANGRADVALSITTLGDASGAALTATATGTTVQIPEPGATLGGAIAFAALAIVRRRRGVLAGLAAAALLVAPAVHAQSALPGDVDQNGRVDRADLAIVTRDRGQTVEESRCGAACDLDGDGTITALDARILVSLCTVTGCAPAATDSGSGSSK